MILAPNDQQVVNLLGLHILLKVGLYYGSYVMNVAPTRTLGHILGTSCVLNVCWRLAKGV
jgi:hypothetical protein